MQTEITSVSLKPESWFDTPAAVFVLTSEDLRRSDATSLAEAMRLVPGVQVSVLDANKWAIAIRGFNNQFSNKVLVLVDGRSVYTPLFAGVYWDSVDVMLEDVERIEVIRGPGATSWGANAVNGVINIITRSSSDIQGTLVGLSVGTEERLLARLRHGGSFRNGASYRVFAKYSDRDGGVDDQGQDAPDGWDLSRFGLQLDWKPREEDHLAVRAGWYAGTLGERSEVATPDPPFARLQETENEIEGTGIQLDWTHQGLENGDLSLRLFAARTDRGSKIIAEIRDTAELEFRHHWSGRRHDIVSGLTYRVTSDESRGSFATYLTPPARRDDLVGALVQDEIRITDRTSLTLGTKLELNDYSGLELQPAVRLSVTPGPRSLLWTAISRAVRTPSRAEHDVRITALVFPLDESTVASVSLIGDNGFDSEEVLSWEVGYRARPVGELWLDSTAFIAKYDDLRSLEAGTPFIETSPPPDVVFPLTANNAASARSSGVEVAMGWSPASRWRMFLSYSWFDIEFRDVGDLVESDPVLTSLVEGDGPSHQAQIRSLLDLGDDWELDVSAFHVGKLVNQDIPAYTRVDVRVGWKPRPGIDLSLSGKNLVDTEHPEFGDDVTGVRSSLVERSLMLTGRFAF